MIELRRFVLRRAPVTGERYGAYEPVEIDDEMIDRAVQALLDGPFHAVQRVSDDTMRLWVRTVLAAALGEEQSALQQ